MHGNKCLGGLREEAGEALFAEARFLLTYLTGGLPSAEATDLYVATLKAAGIHAPLRLPHLVVTFPFLLGMWEGMQCSGLKKRGGGLRTRLRLAALIAATGNSLPSQRGGLGRTVGRALLLAACEFLFLPFRLLVTICPGSK